MASGLWGVTVGSSVAPSENGNRALHACSAVVLFLHSDLLPRTRGGGDEDHSAAA